MPDKKTQIKIKACSVVGSNPTPRTTEKRSVA